MANFSIKGDVRKFCQKVLKIALRSSTAFCSYIEDGLGLACIIYPNVHLQVIKVVGTSSYSTSYKMKV